MAYALPTLATVSPARTGGLGLNVRDAPARTGRRILTLPDNTRADVVGVAREDRNPDSGVLWYQLSFAGRVGFCHGDFLLLDPAPAEPLATSDSVDARRTGGMGLNLRASPSRTAARVASMPDRSPVRIVGAALERFEVGGAMWFQVLFGAQLGFCLGAFLAGAAVVSPLGEGVTGGPARRPFVGVWPVSFPQKVVTARFNQDRPRFRAPIKKHEGIDLRCGANSPPVVAWADGVIEKLFVWNGTLEGDNAYGNYVKIRHDPLGLLSMYCHLMDNSFAVTVGESVRAGQTVGRADNTGNSDAAHLHFMLIDPLRGLDGYVFPKVIDPTPFLPEPYVVLPTA